MMRIVKTADWLRRDFTAKIQCESCGATDTIGGYDDSNYYNNVIPNMACKSCGQKSPLKDPRESLITPRYNPDVVM